MIFEHYDKKSINDEHNELHSFEQKTNTNYTYSPVDFKPDIEIGVDYSNQSITDLKKEFEKFGLDYSDCLEKDDLLRKLYDYHFTIQGIKDKKKKKKK